MAKNMNDFASSLYTKLSSDGEDNIFFSPASIYIAMAMTCCGARNKTAEEIKDVLKLSGKPNDKVMHETIAKVWNVVKEACENEIVSLEMSNRLWLENSYKVQDAFQSLLSSVYNADSSSVDFKEHFEESRSIINKWVADQTNQRIQDLLPNGSVNALTRLVITNAIYFNGKWVLPFKSRMTSQKPFHTSSNVSSNVPMMYQKGKFGYKVDDELKCGSLTLLYSGCSLGMTVVLPDKIDGLQSLENELFTTADFSQKLDSFLSAGKEEVEVFLPKFQFSQGSSLKDLLNKLGIVELFSEGRADLSGLSETNDLFVSDVFHKAFVDVNEEGTEAAAATAVIAMTRCAMRPRPVPVFRADHPFLFMIHDVGTRAILFMGRVCNL